MRWRNTMILLAIFVLLVGYVYLVEMKQEANPAEEPTPQPQVFEPSGLSPSGRSLVADEVTGLRVETAAGQVRLTRPEGQPWMLEEPPQGEADDQRVSALVERVVKLTASRAITVGTGEDLAVFGLASPSLMATLQLTGRPDEVLLVGDKNPQGSAYYVMRRGQPTLYLIYTGLVDDLRRLIEEPPLKPTPTPIPTITPTPLAE